MQYSSVTRRKLKKQGQAMTLYVTGPGDDGCDCTQLLNWTKFARVGVLTYAERQVGDVVSICDFKEFGMRFAVERFTRV
jgi:hypothetical protein